MWCIVVTFVLLGLGSFLCSVVAGRIRVALRMSMAVWSVVFGPGLSPLGSLASMTSVVEMWYVASYDSGLWEVINLCHV